VISDCHNLAWARVDAGQGLTDSRGNFVFGRAVHPVACGLSNQIMAEDTPYRRTRLAILAVLEELARAQSKGLLRMPAREVYWLNTLQKQADTLPENEEELIAEMLQSPEIVTFIPTEYGLGT
jgi:hypothetical protein